MIKIEEADSTVAIRGHAYKAAHRVFQRASLGYISERCLGKAEQAAVRAVRTFFLPRLEGNELTSKERDIVLAAVRKAKEDFESSPLHNPYP